MRSALRYSANCDLCALARKEGGGDGMTQWLRPGNKRRVVAEDHPSLAPLEELGEGDEEEEASSPRTPTSLEDAKRYQRMMRNRQSAATSRERKRKYIQDLEDRVDELTEVVRALQEENTLMRFLELRHEECATLSFLDSVAI